MPHNVCLWPLPASTPPSYCPHFPVCRKRVSLVTQEAAGCPVVMVMASSPCKQSPLLPACLAHVLTLSGWPVGWWPACLFCCYLWGYRGMGGIDSLSPSLPSCPLLACDLPFSKCLPLLHSEAIGVKRLPSSILSPSLLPFLLHQPPTSACTTQWSRCWGTAVARIDHPLE